MQRQLEYERKAREQDEVALLAALEESQRLSQLADAALALRGQVKLLEVRGRGLLPGPRRTCSPRYGATIPARGMSGRGGTAA